MSRDLHDLLHEAAARPADDLDVAALRAAGRRAGRRRRLARGLQASAGVVALLAVVAVVAQLARSPDVAVDNPTSPSSPSATDIGGPPVPGTPRVEVAAGTYDGSSDTWRLYAWWSTDGELCLQGPIGMSCGTPEQTADPATGFLGFNSSSSLTRDGPRGCAVAAVGDGVAEVEFAFWGGITSRVAATTPDDPRIDAAFAVSCWAGHRQLVGARAFDADGTQTDTYRPDQLARTITKPVTVGDTWHDDTGRLTDPATIQAVQTTCDGRRVLLLQLGGPLTSNGQQPRRYVRDPDHTLPAGQLQAAYVADTTLPSDAEYSGYATDTAELWTNPTDDTAIYVVTLDHTEQWPRLTPTTTCQ